MKIGVSSYSFSKYIKAEKCDYIKICDLAKEMGFDGIEFTPLENPDYNITTDPFKTAKEIREHCEKIGLEIIAYTVGVNLCCDNANEELEKLYRYIDVAEVLGAKTLRHDVCYGLKKDNHLYDYNDAIEDMVPLIRKATEYAQKKGIRTCTENHGFIFQAPERVEQLINAVNHKNYGWLCDMGNFLCADADPVESVAIAAPHAFHVHVKDFLYKDGEGVCPPGFFGTSMGNYIRGTVIGHGVVPVNTCINILKRAGYNEWISIEFEGMEDCLPAIKAGIDYLKKII